MLVWLSVASIASCGVTVGLANLGTVAVFTAAFVFGATTFPIYSVAAAHAHDWATDDQRVELSAALMFYYALGAIFAPFTTSGLIAAYGPGALFGFIGAAHLGLLAFSLFRMRKRAPSETRAPYVWIPRTSFQVGRIFRRPR